MTFSHFPIYLWEEVAISIRRIITTQRRSTPPFDQAGFNLYSLTKYANLKKEQRFLLATVPKGGESIDLGRKPVRNSLTWKHKVTGKGG